MKLGCGSVHIVKKKIEEGHLESHMDSNKHTRYKEWHDRKVMLEQCEARGDLPKWIEIRDRMEFCKICDTRATEAHLESRKHMKNLAWIETSTAVSPQFTFGPINDSVPMFASVPTLSQPFPIPPEWGNPNNFEWKAEKGCYYCKLCWKNVDEAHIYSE